MRWLRDWLGWAAAWTLIVQAQMWVWVGLDVLDERHDPTLDANPVAAGVPTAALVLAVLVPVAALLSLVPRTRRPGLALGGAGLLLAAWVWSGFAAGDVGGWYVGLSAAAGVAALAAAAIGTGTWSSTAGDPMDRPTTRIAGLALVAAGAFLVWTCVKGGDYWHWMGAQQWTYGTGVAVGGALVVLGAAAPWWTTLQSTRVPLAVALVTGLLAVMLLVTAHGFFDSRGGMLYRWDENESPWGFGTPALIAGTGLLAAAVAAVRRRGDLVAASVAAGTGVGLLALWQESTWGSVMR